jgi:hypothetical protein
MPLPRRALVWDPKHGWIVAERRPSWNDWVSVPGTYTVKPAHFLDLPPLPGCARLSAAKGGEGNG